MTTASSPDDAVRIGVDVGGTFTDVALAVEGRLVTAKVPTTDDQSEGVLDGIRKACRRADVEPGAVDEFAHATTVSVNALLERDGARTALVTTAGFRDVLEIGRQDRPALYDLGAEKPAPLVPRRRRFEVDERTTPDGVQRAVDPDAVRELAGEIRATEPESVVVSLLHAYAEPENERIVAGTLRESLDVPVSASHEVLAEFREYERTATAAVDAYVRPVIDRYVGRLIDRAADAGLPSPWIMQANGGIADAETVRTRPVTTVLSGPAAGVVGAGATAAGSTAAPEARFEGLVTFDMGGTSSDVSLVREGRAERTTESEIDGVPVRTPMVDVTTVGAGGGSIAWVDAGGALRVGPRSAGADPGPACYGAGGTDATVTDANVALGYIGPEAALGGELEVDVAAAREALGELAAEAGLEGADAAARGIYRVANATMARAIRSVTVERGHDPRRFALVAFGGAGPMHAAALAASMDVDRVIVPRPAGVLSAFGLLAADETHDAARTVRARLGAGAEPGLEETYAGLEERALASASDPDAATVRRAADCRYDGQSFELSVPVPEPFDGGTVRDRFREAHESAYGYAMDEPVEAVTLRATATIERTPPPIRHAAAGDALLDRRTVQFPGPIGDGDRGDGRSVADDPDDGDGDSEGEPGTVSRETPVFARDALPVGRRLEGPAVLEQAESTAVVPPGWGGVVRDDGSLLLERRPAGGDSGAAGGGSR
ncbi:MAG: hydantoinase/oxoprolinase family protein [Haloferacaceae archaeon]